MAWLPSVRQQIGVHVTIAVSTTRAEVLVTITGDLDLSMREPAADALLRISRSDHSEVVIDVCGMAFMDSTGATWLIGLAEDAQRRGSRATLRGASDRDLFVIEVCGALDLFRVDREHRCA